MALTIPHRAISAVVSLGVVLLLLTPTLTAGAQASRDSISRVVLVGVTVFDGTGHPVRPNQSVLIEGERITAIFPARSRPLPAGATMVLRSDPLRDIRNTRSIQLVMKRGRVYRQSDVPMIEVGGKP